MCTGCNPPIGRRIGDLEHVIYKLRAASILIESFCECRYFLGDDCIITGHPPGHERYVEPSECRCNIFSMENNICRPVCLLNSSWSSRNTT